MKKTIKLRDMTEEQYHQWLKSNCILSLNATDCKTCPFYHCVVYEACPFYDIFCRGSKHESWTEHKDLYSDKFLDQTVEVEIPDLLTEEEKALLNKLIGLSAFKIHGINFIICDGYVLVELITANPCEPNDFFHFKKGMFKGIEETKRYAPSDLGLEDK